MLPLFSVYRSKAAGGDALCSAIALAHRDAGIVFFKESVKSFLQLYGQRVAAAENAFQTRQIYSVQALYSEKSLVESRYSCDKIRFMFLKQLSVAFRVKSGLNGISRHLPPFASMECMHTPSPKPWKIGMTASILSPGLNIGLVAIICCETKR